MNNDDENKNQDQDETQEKTSRPVEDTESEKELKRRLEILRRRDPFIYK